MDLAELASASSGANADMLLYTTQAQIHIFIINKKTSSARDFFVAPDLARVERTNQRYVYIIFKKF